MHDTAIIGYPVCPSVEYEMCRPRAVSGLPALWHSAMLGGETTVADPKNRKPGMCRNRHDAGLASGAAGA